MAKVSIGLPVYNGERYLAEAFDSVLGQSYGEFELIVSDNCSTDQTEDICRDYVARDPRVVYHRARANRGPAWNFNHVARLASGRLFKWVCHDDRWHPQMLERSMEVMDDAPPRVALCYPRTVFIDADGSTMETYQDRLDLREHAPPVRLARLMANLGRCNAVFGLMRRDVLLETRLLGAYPHADRVLLAEIALRGELWEIPEELFFRRLHPAGSTFANTDAGQRRRFWDPARRGEIFTLPKWRVAGEHLRAVQHAPLSSVERRAAHRAVLRHYTRVDRNVLVNDIKSLIYRLAFSRRSG